ncbi:unnamed protein product [Meganyctiphanes norvegica]|uniref:CHK kinase-like domain-containing protein n=1 Tax=Meganyctiphanes norvegica TaxID=48144 RepID=A0AAV2QPU1_MEGNR
MSQGIFKTEDLFYTQLVPLLNQQLTDVGAQALRFPKIFFAINSEDCQFMIMENLKTSGFARRNKRLGLDAPHTRLVVQELGRFNAASLILEKSLGTKIEDKYPRFKGKLWSESMKFLGPWMSSLFEDTISLAKREGSKYDGVQRWLENAKKTPLELLDQNLQDDAAQFSVLGHNDCWTANLMFRYTKDDEPEDVRLFDFQAPRKTSVAIDLNNLFYNSMNGTNRKAHRKELLSLYYNSFSAILSSKGQSPPFTLQELDDECHRKMIHGVLYGIMFTKMAIGAPVDQGDWNVFEEAKDGESQATIKGNNNEEEVRQRFLDLFEDMIQFDIVA